MSDLSKYSGGPNPPMLAMKLLEHFTSRKPEEQVADVLSKHMAYVEQTHQHAVGLLNAHFSGVISHMKETNKLAEPGTQVSVASGAQSASYTKRTPKARAAAAPAASTPKPLPVRDPKTGRAMKAPQ